MDWIVSNGIKRCFQPVENTARKMKRARDEYFDRENENYFDLKSIELEVAMTEKNRAWLKTKCIQFLIENPC